MSRFVLSSFTTELHCLVIMWNLNVSEYTWSVHPSFLIRMKFNSFGLLHDDSWTLKCRPTDVERLQIRTRARVLFFFFFFSPFRRVGKDKGYVFFFDMNLIEMMIMRGRIHTKDDNFTRAKDMQNPSECPNDLNVRSIKFVGRVSWV